MHQTFSVFQRTDDRSHLVGSGRGEFEVWRNLLLKVGQKCYETVVQVLGSRTQRSLYIDQIGKKNFGSGIPESAIWHDGNDLDFLVAKCFDNLSDPSGINLIFSDEIVQAKVCRMEKLELDAWLDAVQSVLAY